MAVPILVIGFGVIALTIYVIAIVLYRNFFAYFWRVKLEKSEGHQANVDWFRRALLDANENNHVYIIAGELNPYGYEELVQDFEDALDRDTEITFLFGPSLAVFDDYKERPFVHPIVELTAYAELTNKKKNLRLFTHSKRVRFQSHSGAIGTIHAAIEEEHSELKERSLAVYSNNPIVSRSIQRKIEKFIELNVAKPIDIEDFINQCKNIKPEKDLRKTETITEDIKEELTKARSTLLNKCQKRISEYRERFPNNDIPLIQAHQ